MLKRHSRSPRYGALSTIECWGDEVPYATQTDFKRAVALKDGESVCFLKRLSA